MLISYDALSPEALKGIAQDYVQINLSEVDSELQTECWIEQVVESVKRGELLIEYSEANESVYLKRPEDVAHEKEVL